MERSDYVTRRCLLNYKTVMIPVLLSGNKTWPITGHLANKTWDENVEALPNKPGGPQEK